MNVTKFENAPRQTIITHFYVSFFKGPIILSILKSRLQFNPIKLDLNHDIKLGYDTNQIVDVKTLTVGLG